MLRVDIPGVGDLELQHLVLDLNGTLARDGVILPGVTESIEALRGVLSIVVTTADTFGTAADLMAPLGIEVRHIEAGREAEDKLDVVDELGGDGVVAIGNGANDTLMLRDAAVGIAVVGPEGCARDALLTCDIALSSIEDAFGLLLEPRRLAATMRR